MSLFNHVACILLNQCSILSIPWGEKCNDKKHVFPYYEASGLIGNRHST